jgi:hypothetical protein
MCMHGCIVWFWGGFEGDFAPFKQWCRKNGIDLSNFDVEFLPEFGISLIANVALEVINRLTKPLPHETHPPCSPFSTFSEGSFHSFQYGEHNKHNRLDSGDWVQTDDDVLRVPMGAMLSTSTCLLTTVGTVLVADEKLREHPEVSLAVCLLAERQNQKSYWKEYISMEHFAQMTVFPHLKIAFLFQI